MLQNIHPLIPRLSIKPLIVAFLCPLYLYSQHTSDIELLASTQFENPIFDKRTVNFGFSDSVSVFKKYNPVNLIFSSAMYIYQTSIYKQLGGNCLYNPSCSVYSKQLIAEYGLLKGIFVTADRLSRCNRLATTDIKEYNIDHSDGKVHETITIYK